MATLKVTNIKNESFAGDQLYLKSDGRLGIGTTSPDSNLDIEGSGSPELRVTDTTNTVGAYIQSNDTKAIFGSRTNHPVQLEQNAGAALFIDTSKNVGIGTTSPDAQLEVSSSSLSSTGTRRAGLGFLTAGATPGNLTEKLRITNDGNVGIGTTSPDTNLEINGGADAIAKVTGTTTAARLDLKTNSHHRFIQTLESDGAFRIYDQTNNSERVRIDSSGRVMIGATTIDNNAMLHIEKPTSGECGVWIESTQSGAGSYILLKNNSTSGNPYSFVGGIDAGGQGTSQINFHNLDNANNVGELSLSTRPSGSTMQERLRIKSDGDIEVGGNLKTNNLPGRNLIINGEFAIWQRGITSINMSQNKYLTDRFKAMSSTDGDGSIHQHANVPTQVQTGGSQFPYSLRVNCTTADTSLAAGQYITINHRIEGYNLRQLGFGLAGTRYATLSFWQRSPSGTYHVAFRNNAYNRYYIGSYTAANNTWEKHVITIPIDTSGTWESGNSMGLDIQWSLGCGSNNSGGTVGSWSSGSKHAGSSQKNFYDTVGNDFYLTGVQFEKGSIATQFEHRSHGEELLSCYRYYHQITNPRMNGYIPDNASKGYVFDMQHPVPMRSGPTVTITNTGSVGGQYVFDGSSNALVTTLIGAYSTSGSDIRYTEMDLNLSGDLTDTRGAWTGSANNTGRRSVYTFSSEL